MRIAILSGKGGTGKTTVATNLLSVSGSGVLIDTDVEEPNSHLFLKPQINHSEAIKKRYPIVDATLCKLCGACGDFCRFNAILPAKKEVLIFKELCHDCGGCKLVCPQGAIQFKERSIGMIHTGMTLAGQLMHYGELSVGEISGVAIIERLHQISKDEELVFVDCPPGTACSTVAAIESADYAIVVAEPTPFGVSDMTMVVELLRDLEIPMGVVVNKDGLGDDEIYHYCEAEKLQILGRIPFKKDYAKYYAGGNLISRVDDEYRENITGILAQVTGQKEGE
jgi:MinD superfamily P-loop ATPase